MLPLKSIRMRLITSLLIVLIVLVVLVLSTCTVTNTLYIQVHSKQVEPVICEDTCTSR
jgi:hypothetical protein